MCIFWEGGRFLQLIAATAHNFRKIKQIVDLPVVIFLFVGSFGGMSPGVLAAAGDRQECPLR